MLEVWQQSQLFSFELCTEQTHPRFSNQAWRLSPDKKKQANGVPKMPGVSQEVFPKNAPAVGLQRNRPARNGELSGYRSPTTHPVNSGCLKTHLGSFEFRSGSVHFSLTPPPAAGQFKFHHHDQHISLSNRESFWSLLKRLSQAISLWEARNISRNCSYEWYPSPNPWNICYSCMPVNEFLQFDR